MRSKLFHDLVFRPAWATILQMYMNDALRFLCDGSDVILFTHRAKSSVYQSESTTLNPAKNQSKYPNLTKMMSLPVGTLHSE